jgi:hypothetical protein
MLKHILEAKSYLKDNTKSPSNVHLSKSENLTIISLTTHNCVMMILEQLEKIGFTGIELSEKTSAFLRCTTKQSSDKTFSDIIYTLEKVDTNFKESKLYFALKALRALCNEHNDDTQLDFFTAHGTKAKISVKEISKELVFYSCFLLEVIIKYFDTLRNNYENKNITAAELRKRFDESFDDIVVSLVTSMLKA